MAIRAGLATVAGAMRVPYRHSGTWKRPQVTYAEIDPFPELRYFIEQEEARLKSLKHTTRTQ